MSAAGWIIVIIIVLPMLGLLTWAVLRSSFVRVPSGSLGLVVIRGRATDKALPPGPAFVAAMRRHTIELYPSVEQSYRADGGLVESPLTSSAPTLTLMLGDRNTVTVSVTVRFRIMRDQLRLVHERFGPNGVFSVVRDETGRAVLRALGAPDVSVKDLLGAAREETESKLSVAVAQALQADGLELTSFTLGIVDLGRVGEVVAAITRAGYEREREEAEAETRLARARNDAELQQNLVPGAEYAWRYRGPDLWRDLAEGATHVSVALSAEARTADSTTTTGPTASPPARSQ